MTSSPLRKLLILSLSLLLLGAVQCLEQVALPHLDVYLLCSNDVDGFNAHLQMQGFYNDLLPSAAEILVTVQNPRFDNCLSDPNRTQVAFSSDGTAEFSLDTLMTQADIASLVTRDALGAYLESACEDRDVFDMQQQLPGSEPQESVTAAFFRGICSTNVSVMVANGLRTGTIVIIAIAAVALCCIIGCICACCGACT